MKSHGIQYIYSERWKYILTASCWTSVYKARNCTSIFCLSRDFWDTFPDFIFMKTQKIGMISGIVITGKQLGRTIGFPTANIFLAPWNVADGTYGLIVEVRGKRYFGIGVYLEKFSTFESHILSFDWDIYGEDISVDPLFRIRENQKFSSLEELKKQIQKDQEFMEKWIEKSQKWAQFLL